MLHVQCCIEVAHNCYANICGNSATHRSTPAKAMPSYDKSWSDVSRALALFSEFSGQYTVHYLVYSPGKYESTSGSSHRYNGTIYCTYLGIFSSACPEPIPGVSGRLKPFWKGPSVLLRLVAVVATQLQ